MKMTGEEMQEQLVRGPFLPNMALHELLAEKDRPADRGEEELGLNSPSSARAHVRLQGRGELPPVRMLDPWDARAGGR
jgi:hypothetical protein